MPRADNGATAAQDATANVLDGVCRMLWVRCDSGSLTVKISNSNDDQNVHDASDSFDLAVGETMEFYGTIDNPINSFVPAGVGASATYSFTVKLA